MLPYSETYGALLLGGLFAMFLSGIVALQVFLYRRHYPHDRRRNKAMVATVWLLDLLHSAFICVSIFRYMMLGLNDSTAIQRIYWSVSVTISITGTLTFLVHCFFTIRVWTLSKHNKWLCGSIFFLAFIRMVSAYGTVAEMSRFHTWRAFHHGAAWIFTTGLAISATVDFLIAFSLVWFLRKSRTGFSSMDQILDTIMVYTIENGLLTSVATVASFICWLTMPRNFIFLGIHFCISKLYSNSFLATLNARSHIKERSQSSQEHNSYRLTSLLSRKSTKKSESTSPQSPRRPSESLGRSSTLQISVEKTVHCVTDLERGGSSDPDTPVKVEVRGVEPVYAPPGRRESGDESPVSAVTALVDEV